MGPRYETRRSTHDEGSVTLREQDIAPEFMGDHDFGTAFFYLLTG